MRKRFALLSFEGVALSGLLVGLGLAVAATNARADEEEGGGGGSSANCNVQPQNPIINAGGAVSWSAQVSGVFSPSYSWSFSTSGGTSPSQTSSNSSTPTVRYNSAGTSTTTLEVIRRGTVRASCSTTVTVEGQSGGGGGGQTANQPPAANANGPYSGTTGQAVSFSSAGSNDPDGTINTYAWSFGDGGTSTQSNPSHTYANAGSYNVSLTVTDNQGASSAPSTTTATIQSPANQSPTANANGPYTGTVGAAITFSSAGSSDPDGTISSYAWTFGDGGTSSAQNPTHTYASASTFTVTLTVTDNGGASSQSTTTVSVAANTACASPVTPPKVSINSTSQESACQNTNVVTAQGQVANSSYSVLAINDLGMHCGDLDTRVASILPPYQVLLAQVIQKGSTPVVNPSGISVAYSAVTNPNDPILGQGNGVFTGVKADGSTYKTNFWDGVANGTYDAFYPGGLGITPLATGAFPVTPDVGLPVPNVENLYIGPDGRVNSGDETLTAVQHAMPGVDDPYVANAPKTAEEHYIDKPFFVNFPFGYVAAGVNWWEAAGIPFSAFDDFGRENAYPLVRVQAMNAQGQALSTVDTVLPISGEASCTNCHSTNTDYTSVHGVSNRTESPTNALSSAGLPVATSLDDPDTTMPPKVSLEYAADINILRLHDLRHGPDYVDTSGNPAPCVITSNGGNGGATCLTNLALLQNKPVVCQVCHYTPALDLAHVGPLAGPPGSEANGRNQLAHESNSRVMHDHHGQFTSLFPPIPAPQQDANGNITNQAQRLTALENSCYQCHPGKTTQCLRGAMFNGGMLCSDCHGTMAQVGDDFSKNVSPSNPGAFVMDAGNFYTPGSAQPRVPWANEPTCGSCHTGDASSNLAGTAGTIVNIRDTNGNGDGIRLRQAYRTGDAKATPIVPTNKRFAEPAVPASFNGFANPGAGNPQLYRVSTGHGGVMCEGCHGATHAEWPNANPASNDNQTAQQLQGHTGVIIECSTCHGTAMNNTRTLNGPHGMHPVGSSTSWANGGHSGSVSGNNCVVCHGAGATSNSRSQNNGSVLSRAAADRTLRGRTVLKGQLVGCATCHGGGLGG